MEWIFHDQQGKNKRNLERNKATYISYNALKWVPSMYNTLPSKLIINEQEMTKLMIKPLLISWINSSPVLEENLASAVLKANLPFNIIVIILGKPQASSFFLSPTNSTYIENIIISLSSAKACSPFSISTSLPKTLKGVISIPLQLHFNCSFFTGLVPNQVKMASQ